MELVWWILFDLEQVLNYVGLEVAKQFHFIVAGYLVAGNVQGTSQAVVRLHSDYYLPQKGAIANLQPDDSLSF